MMIGTREGGPSLFLVMSVAFLVAWSSVRAGTSQSAPVEKRKSLLDPIGLLGESILRPKDPYQVIPGRDPNGWSFTLEPYGWLPALSGNVGIRGLPMTQIGYSARNVLGNVKWATFARGEVRKGRWGLLGDGLFAELSASGGSPGPLYENATVRVQQGMASLALAFRVIDDRRWFLDVYAGARYNYFDLNIGTSVDTDGVEDLSNGVAGRITERVTEGVDRFLANNIAPAVEAVIEDVQLGLDSRELVAAANIPKKVKNNLKELQRALAGAGNPVRELVAAIAAQRLAASQNQLTSSINNRVTQAQKKLAQALAKGLEEELPTSVGGSQWWVDPIIGVRGQVNVTRWLFLATQADVGGFGAGSQIAWNVTATVGVNFTRQLYGELGYRYYYMDYEQSGSVFQVAEAGIFSGVGVKF